MSLNFDSRPKNAHEHHIDLVLETTYPVRNPTVILGIRGGADIRIEWDNSHSTEIRFDKDKKEEVINSLNNKYGPGKLRVTNTRNNIEHSVIEYSNLIVLFSDDRLYAHTPIYSIIKELNELLDSFKLTAVDQVVYILNSSIEGLRLCPIGKINEPLIEENYGTEVVTAIRNSMNWVSSKKPNGRITIMSGPPGTGKTYAIRAMITEVKDVDWVLVPSNIVPRLSGPDFISCLTEDRTETKNPLALIIEDGDALIRRRDQNDENVVSNILNLGDGIFADLINVRLIFTTNCPRVQIDDAVTRNGRLNSMVEFRPLNKDEANNVVKRLSGVNGTYNEDINLCDIYADVFNYKKEKPKKKKVPGQYL